jgi:hypothetical protein
MKNFLIVFETSEQIIRRLEIKAPTIDAALIKWDLLRQPGDFIESITAV